MPNPALNILDYWSNYFGINANFFKSTNSILIPHVAFKNYWGIWIFNIQESQVISVPEVYLARCQKLLSQIEHKQLIHFDIIKKVASHFAIRLNRALKLYTVTPST